MLYIKLPCYENKISYALRINSKRRLKNVQLENGYNLFRTTLFGMVKNKSQFLA